MAPTRNGIVIAVSCSRKEPDTLRAVAQSTSPAVSSGYWRQNVCAIMPPIE